MAKRKWNRFLELILLSRLRRRAPAGLAPSGLQSGLGRTFPQLRTVHGGIVRRHGEALAAWGGSATQEEADAAAAKHAEFSASLQNLTWEDYTPLFGACFVHNRWWRGAGECPFCPEKSNGEA